jgi:hypothetical protein
MKFGTLDLALGSCLSIFPVQCKYLGYIRVTSTSIYKHEQKLRHLFEPLEFSAKEIHKKDSLWRNSSEII